MKRKISTQDLLLGMYVSELDRPWESAPFEPPFDLQGFTIRKIGELERLQELCRYVYIDPNLGIGSTKYLSEGYSDADMAHMLEQITESVPIKELYPEEIPVEEELDRAEEILNDTRNIFFRVTRDIQTNKAVGHHSVADAVGQLVESVLRNPAATAWLVQLKHRDEASYSHAISVCVMALTLGRFLGLPIQEMHRLGIAALLQDVGKVKLPTELLNKKSPLNEYERDQIKQHVNISVLLLKLMKDISSHVLEIVAYHHERFDGAGYPQGASGSQIGMLASITGLVDSFVAMTSDRPYRERRTPFEALMELYDQREKAFPGGLVEQFIQCVGIFPLGSFVQLNTEEVGVVVHRNRVEQLKPRIMILIDRNGKKLTHPHTIDLAAQYLLPSKTMRAVTKIVDPKKYNLDPTEFFGDDIAESVATADSFRAEASNTDYSDETTTDSHTALGQ